MINQGQNGEILEQNQFMRTAIMDEDYLIVAAHVDETLESRVCNGDYVDFSRLIPRDRVQMEQDNRIELLTQNGQLSCARMDSGSGFSITSFARWEQAFRVYSNIYTQQFPQCAAELIQYNHVIHTASLTYSWSNVYAYDIDFRLHMLRHPQRSWSVILQQAWNLRLKDRHDNGDHKRASLAGGNSYNKRRDICFRFNAGCCTYGSRCKFEHKCVICGKFGHGAYNCRHLSDKPDRYHDSNDRNDRDKHHNRKQDNGKFNYSTAQKA